MQAKGRGGGVGRRCVQAGRAQELKSIKGSVCVGVMDLALVFVRVFVLFGLGRRGRNPVYKLSLIVFSYT